MYYKIKEVADMVGVSVRTLHHYDQINLMKPKLITPAGYRLYTEGELERLQQVLFFKELDFTLQEIKDILDRPDFDRKHALKTQRELLLKKKSRLEKIIKSVEKTIESIEGGIEMNDKEMFDGLDMTEIQKHKQKYAEETKQKYGNSDAYKESMKKTSKYTKEDWARIMKRGEEINERMASLMDRNPADAEVQQAVAQWRQYITDSFYNCTPEIFRGLADLYVNDERFTKNIDKYRSGLTQFLTEAMQIYCDNLK